MKNQGSTSTAEEIRQSTVTLLKREKKQTGKAKMDWPAYEEIMRNSLPFEVNRGFLFGLLLAKKFGKIRITLELIDDEKPGATSKNGRKK